MITSKEALDISLKNNSDVKSILSTIELLSMEGKTETDWIKCDKHCVRILSHLGYKIESVEGLGEISIVVSW